LLRGAIRAPHPRWIRRGSAGVARIRAKGRPVCAVGAAVPRTVWLREGAKRGARRGPARVPRLRAALGTARRRAGPCPALAGPLRGTSRMRAPQEDRESWAVCARTSRGCTGTARHRHRHRPPPDAGHHALRLTARVTRRSALVAVMLLAVRALRACARSPALSALWPHTSRLRLCRPRSSAVRYMDARVTCLTRVASSSIFSCAIFARTRTRRERGRAGPQVAGSRPTALGDVRS